MLIIHGTALPSAERLSIKTLAVEGKKGIARHSRIREEEEQQSEWQRFDERRMRTMLACVASACLPKLDARCSCDWRQENDHQWDHHEHLQLIIEASQAEALQRLPELVEVHRYQVRDPVEHGLHAIR